MSAAIRSSLIKLNEAVERLETSVKTASSAPKAAQTDLFGAVSSKKPANNIDAKALAKRLDSTIDRVERLLKEGRA